MDPNTMLQPLREWARMAVEAGSHDETELDAAKAFLSLDDWMSSGGCPPEVWQKSGA